MNGVHWATIHSTLLLDLKRPSPRGAPLVPGRPSGSYPSLVPLTVIGYGMGEYHSWWWFLV